MGAVFGKGLVGYRRAQRLIHIGLWTGFVFILFGCASDRTVSQHPEFKVRIAAAMTTMLVPPDVVVIRGSSESTGTQLPEEAAKYANNLSNSVAAELSRHGFEVKLGPAQNPAVNDLNENLIRTTPINWPEVARLAKQAGAGSLVVTSLYVFKRSTGDIMAEAGKSFLTYILTAGLFGWDREASGWARLQVELRELKEGAPGEALWGNETSEVSFFSLIEPDFLNDLDGMVTHLFRPFPLQVRQ